MQTFGHIYKNIVSFEDTLYVKVPEWFSELSSGIYCRVKWLPTDVPEVRTASIIRDEENSEHHTNRRENLKSHIPEWLFVLY
jgi:hypothetical protein